MTFDIRTYAIGYDEPALWAAVVVAALVAAGLGALVGLHAPAMSVAWKRRVLGGCGTFAMVAIAMVLGPVLLQTLFAAAQGGGIACAHLVWPALYAPPVLGLAVEALLWRRVRHRGRLA